MIPNQDLTENRRDQMYFDGPQDRVFFDEIIRKALP